MTRGCLTLVIDPERAADYEALHAEPWPDLMEAIVASGFRNYCGFRRGATSSTTASTTRTWPRSSAGWRSTTSTALGQGVRGDHHHDHRCPTGASSPRRRSITRTDDRAAPHRPAADRRPAPVLDALGAHGRAHLPGGPARARPTGGRVPVGRLRAGRASRRLRVGRRGGGAGPGPRRRRVDAILVLQTMAVPSAYTLALLDGAAGRARRALGAARDRARRRDFDHGGITTQGATVGAPMLSNMFARRDRPFELVLGRIGDPATVGRVREALRLAAVARASPGAPGAGRRAARRLPARRRDDAELRAGTGHRGRAHGPRRARGRVPGRSTRRRSRLEAEVRAGWVFEEDVDAGEAWRGAAGGGDAGGPRRGPPPRRRGVQLPRAPVPVRRADRHRAVLGAGDGSPRGRALDVHRRHPHRGGDAHDQAARGAASTTRSRRSTTPPGRS